MTPPPLRLSDSVERAIDKYGERCLRAGFKDEIHYDPRGGEAKEELRDAIAAYAEQVRLLAIGMAEAHAGTAERGPSMFEDEMVAAGIRAGTAGTQVAAFVQLPCEKHGVAVCPICNATTTSVGSTFGNPDPVEGARIGVQRGEAGISPPAAPLGREPSREAVEAALQIVETSRSGAITHAWIVRLLKAAYRIDFPSGPDGRLRARLSAEEVRSAHEAAVAAWSPSRQSMGVLYECMAELLNVPSGPDPVRARCPLLTEDETPIRDINPYVATCGEEFETYEGMHHHMKKHRAALAAQTDGTP